MDPGFIGYPLNVFEHWSVFPRIDTGPIIFKVVIFTKFSWVNLGKKNELTSSHLGLILACFSYLIRELLCFYRFSLVHVNSLFPTRPFCLLLIKSWIIQCYPILCMWSQSFLNGTVWFNHQSTIFQLTIHMIMRKSYYFVQLIRHLLDLNALNSSCLPIAILKYFACIWRAHTTQTFEIIFYSQQLCYYNFVRLFLNVDSTTWKLFFFFFFFITYKKQ